MHTATIADLDLATLYRILQLRAAVFVVEQRIADQDLDGRDLEPETVHCWIECEGRIVSYLRLLHEGHERRIGRVATAADARGRRYAETLIHHALRLAEPHPVALHAQSHLVGWYQRLGFFVDGDEFMEAGIPHTPMRLPRGTEEGT